MNVNVGCVCVCSITFSCYIMHRTSTGNVTFNDSDFLQILNEGFVGGSFSG